MATGPKYPKVRVQLSGEDGNAFGIVSRVRQALERSGVGREEAETFFDDALSGDYEHVLSTCRAWVKVR